MPSLLIGAGHSHKLLAGTKSAKSQQHTGSHSEVTLTAHPATKPSQSAGASSSYRHRLIWRIASGNPQIESRIVIQRRRPEPRAFVQLLAADTTSQEPAATSCDPEIGHEIRSNEVAPAQAGASPFRTSLTNARAFSRSSSVGCLLTSAMYSDQSSRSLKMARRMKSSISLDGLPWQAK